MSVKIKISTTKAVERNEIMNALESIILKNQYRVKRRRLKPDGENRYIVYIESAKLTCKPSKDMI